MCLFFPILAPGAVLLRFILKYILNLFYLEPDRSTSIIDRDRHVPQAQRQNTGCCKTGAEVMETRSQSACTVGHCSAYRHLPSSSAHSGIPDQSNRSR